MRSLLRIFACWCGAALLSLPLVAQQLPDQMSPPRLVNDFAGLLDEAQRRSLEQKLADFDRETSTQITVVTVDDLDGYAPADYAQRLHDKSYLNAYTYYKIGRYKSAIVSLKNALKQFPDSNHREEIMYMIVDASYRFANNSIANKQTDRYLSMLDSYLSFKEEFPESKYTKEVDRMAKHARDYLDRNKKDEDKDNNI